MSVRAPFFGLIALLGVPSGFATGCAPHHAIMGKVVDRNGEPMDRVIISVDPGAVEMITDSDGAFMVDYLRDDAGERVKLARRSNYTIEAFRTGYHIARTDVYFKKGELLMEPITLAEDTIRVDGSEDNIDPALYPDRTQSAGATYEGE